MTTLTATNARRDFFELVKSTAKGHRIYRIRHRQGSAVLISEEDFSSLMESLELLAIPGFRASIKRSISQMKKGRTFSFAEIMGDKI